ncbi:hypothetical protein ACVWY0_001392 [Arthrobacter sp. UYNi723]
MHVVLAPDTPQQRISVVARHLLDLATRNPLSPPGRPKDDAGSCGANFRRTRQRQSPVTRCDQLMPEDVGKSFVRKTLQVMFDVILSAPGPLKMTALLFRGMVLDPLCGGVVMVTASTPASSKPARLP